MPRLTVGHLVLAFSFILGLAICVFTVVYRQHSLGSDWTKLIAAVVTIYGVPLTAIIGCVFGITLKTPGAESVKALVLTSEVNINDARMWLAVAMTLVYCVVSGIELLSACNSTQLSNVLKDLPATKGWLGSVSTAFVTFYFGSTKS